MKGMIIKAVQWACLISLLLTCFSAWQMYRERNLSQEPVDMAIESIVDPKEDIIYANINGGVIDFMNMYELSTKKRRRTVSTDYFVPVLGPETGNVVYIVKLDDEPDESMLDDSPIFKGILQSSNELPTDLEKTYAETYENSDFYYLDTTYKSKTTFEKLKNLGLFAVAFVVSLIVLILLKRKPKDNN